MNVIDLKLLNLDLSNQLVRLGYPGDVVIPVDLLTQCQVQFLDDTLDTRPDSQLCDLFTYSVKLITGL